MAPNEKGFRGRKVMVTGGLGFIGSNLAMQLVKSGAKVTVADNMIPRLGGNLFNVKEVVKGPDIAGTLEDTGCKMTWPA